MKETSGKIKLISAMIVFGTIGIFVRHINLPSSVIAFARGLIGMSFLILFVLIRGKKISVDAIKKNALVLGISGACIGINWILLFEAYRYTTVATATLCYYLAPIFVIIVSPIILKEKLSSQKAICVFVALVGMVFVSGVLNPENSGNIQAKGILCGIGAAAFYASVMVLNKFIKNISSYDMTIAQLGMATIVILPYVLLTENVAKLSFEPKGIALLIFVGIVHTGITYALYFSSMQILKAQTVAIFSYIDPIVAIFVSVIILRESMDIYSIIGAIMVLGATFVSERIEEK